MDENGDRSLKRDRETEESRSWISSNRTAKAGPVNPDSFPLSNWFDPILELSDLMPDD